MTRFKNQLKSNGSLTLELENALKTMGNTA